MPHMVVFRSGEGKPGYHQVESLDDAVRFVERLRNQEGIADCRVFRMDEVPLEFKTYVKVEVAGAPVGDPVVAGSGAGTGAGPGSGAKVPPAPKAGRASSPIVAADDEPMLGDDPVVVEPLVGNGQAAGRFNRFNRT
jgi:hypothetical protein